MADDAIVIFLSAEGKAALRLGRSSLEGQKIPPRFQRLILP
jgi:hypothetical protein